VGASIRTEEGNVAETVLSGEDGTGLAKDQSAPHASLRASLSIDGLVKEFGGRRILDGISLNVASGQIIAVIGPSGCGKTTLLNIIGGIERPTAGSIQLKLTIRAPTPTDDSVSGAELQGLVEEPGLHQKGGGRLPHRADLKRPGGEYCFDVGRLRRGNLRRYHRDIVGFVFQNAGLVDNWTVAENLRIPLTSEGCPARRPAIREVLEEVGMSGLERARVYTLSGGEQQRVAMARLKLKEPLVVLADEPMAALDQVNADVIFEELGELAQCGSLVWMCTHDPAVVARCDTVVCLPGRGVKDES
jgi:putative ABC transport system ATP-binding protein